MLRISRIRDFGVWMGKGVQVGRAAPEVRGDPADRAAVVPAADFAAGRAGGGLGGGGGRGGVAGRRRVAGWSWGSWPRRTRGKFRQPQTGERGNPREPVLHRAECGTRREAVFTDGSDRGQSRLRSEPVWVEPGRTAEDRQADQERPNVFLFELLQHAFASAIQRDGNASNGARAGRGFHAERLATPAGHLRPHYA